MPDVKVKEAPKPKEPLVIPFNAAQLSEYVSNSRHVTVPAGTKIEELLVPDAWGPLSQHLKARDELHCQPADGGWYAQFLVRAAWSGGAQVVLVHQVKLPPMMERSADRVPPGYTIRQEETVGWTIRRDADSVVMASQSSHPELTDRESCVRHLLQHATLRAPNAGPWHAT